MTALDQNDMLRRMIEVGPDQASVPPDWGVQLSCPICGESYVHLGSAEQRRDDGIWSGRGGAIYLSMTCEAGHGWTLRFGFHKGNTYLAIEGIGVALENVVEP